ncbi:TetR/AcrR family transcriptional regulator [Dactylosporangium sp. CA-233914]|uniref:TetR/AcrR family transcriptional regulator n=1 Tax=Dactylosporangium sp. CA-233914 TaxID=3239934 RepID=UPI003D945E98
MSGEQDDAGAAPRTIRQAGRPPLTERRKAEIRREIARQAVRLFNTKGVAATSAEEIAAAAGISVRTLWRHFPNKEHCVLPLLNEPLGVTIQAVLRWHPGHDAAELVDAMEHGAEEAVAADKMGNDIPALLDLVRLTRTEPGLRLVWIRSRDEAEQMLADALARRAGLTAPDLTVRVHAAVMNSALQAAMEHYAFHTSPTAGDPAALRKMIRDALLIAAHGLS